MSGGTERPTGEAALLLDTGEVYRRLLDLADEWHALAQHGPGSFSAAVRRTNCAVNVHDAAALLAAVIAEGKAAAPAANDNEEAF